MRRMGAIVRKLYAEELKSAPDTRRKSKKSRGVVSRMFSDLQKTLSQRRSVVWIMRIVIVAAVLFIIAETVFQFNRLTSGQTVVTARSADVDRELKRRRNLIPNLVYAVSQYAAYEQGVFRYVSDAREALKMIKAPGAPKTAAGSMLEKLLPRLVALAEQYPDLKTSGAIHDLIAEASNTENRIADAKKDYNSEAETYNQHRTTFPGNLFAACFGFEAAPYMGLNEDVDVPTIDLSVPHAEITAGRE